jgi:ligand-binding SRPBCC domain-containing protein
MPTFNFQFNVNAPLKTVSAFHHDSSVLKTLSPPPIFTQIHHFDPMGEGAIAEFTLWFGPLPIRWRAIHSNVSINGFTDTQERGPLKFWQHTHRFTAVSPTQTHIHEHIEYEHHAGIKGILSRLLFSKLGLYGLFTARKLITRYHVKRMLATNR